jgi:hypothetical protein
MADSCGYNPIVAWVAAHRESLPRTLGELSRYPVAYRRVIQGRVPADVRLGFWRDHLESFLAAPSSLNDDQQAFVREVLGQLDDIFVAKDVDGQARAKEFESRMPPLFSREQAHRIFALLGPPEPPGGIAPPAE